MTHVIEILEIFANFRIPGLVIFALLIVIVFIVRSNSKMHQKYNPHITISLTVICTTFIILFALSINIPTKKVDYKCPSQNVRNDSRENTESEAPYFMKEWLTEKHLEGKTDEQLGIIRNEIYARHGIGFNRENLRDHFCRFPWYNPIHPPGTTPSWNVVQSCNAVFIREYQAGIRGKKLIQTVDKTYGGRCNHDN